MKQASGNILHVRSFHLAIRVEGDFHALSFRDGEQGGLPGYRFPHSLKQRVFPGIPGARRAIGPDFLATESVQALGSADWQRAQQQRIYDLECGEACAQTESQRKDSRGRSYLAPAQSPPSQYEIPRD